MRTMNPVPTTSNPPPRHAVVIAIGTELTLGQTVDTNSARLAQWLAGLGIRAAWHVTVPDELAPIRAALAEAARRADVILVTGGLGPTDDDLTRQALADEAGAPLESDPESVAHIRAFFAALKRPMPERNLVQALIPRGGRAISNPVGTAPGLYVELHGTPCYVLPGVPAEMERMFQQEVAPRLRAAVGGRVLLQRRLHCFGLGESVIGERIADLMQRGRNPEVGTTAELGIIGVRINATADAAPQAAALLDEAERTIRARLGDVVFGRDKQTLSSVVGQLLTARGATLSTAESCTGGLLGKLLTDVPGSSTYYLGGLITYANAVKSGLAGVPAADIERHGAVSEPVAVALAAGCHQRLGSDFALSITGIAGPAGGSTEKPVGLVYVGLATPTDVSARALQLGAWSSRRMIRARAAYAALDWLRLHLARVGR
jgi:nicotinamide-nucleotide amidase